MSRAALRRPRGCAAAEEAPAPKKKRGRPKKVEFAARDRVKVVEHAKYQGRLGTVVKQNTAWIEVCLDARFPGDAVTSAFRKKDLEAVDATPPADDDDDLISDDGHDEALVGRRVGIPLTKGGGFGVVARVTDGMCEVNVEKGDGFDIGGLQRCVTCHIGELTLADGGPPTPVAPAGSPRKPASKPRGRKPAAAVPDDAAAFRARQDARRAAQAAQDSPAAFKPVAPQVPSWPTGDATPPPPPPPRASGAPILVRTAGGRSATVIPRFPSAIASRYCSTTSRATSRSVASKEAGTRSYWRPVRRRTFEKASCASCDGARNGPPHARTMRPLRNVRGSIMIM